MDFASGSQIGKYTLGRKLGQGGFGLVFAAHDAKLGCDVALKFLKQEYTRDQAVLKRFLQEARAASKIVHPGIVKVLECGQLTETNSTADGTAYIAMELLEGESLTDRLTRCGRLPIEAAMQIGRQAAAAFEAAHCAGIVHRDVKPDNILLVPDPALPGGERVKILDFGIAKLAHTSPNTVQTESMMVFGTPRYMSPELCKSAACVDHRSDIYQLGCILFELVAGRPPFVGVTGELIAQHLLVPPPALKTFVKEVSPALGLLVDQMLAKEPESRPPSMVVIERRLEACGAPAPQRDTLGIPEVTRPYRTTGEKDPRETTTLSSMARSRARSEGGWRRRASPQVVFGGTLAVILMLVVVVAVARGSDAPAQAAMPEAETVKMQVEAPPELARPESPAERAQREAANLDVAVREAARLDEAKPEAGETASLEVRPTPPTEPVREAAKAAKHAPARVDPVIRREAGQADVATREAPRGDAAKHDAVKADAARAEAAKRETAKADAGKREAARLEAAKADAARREAARVEAARREAAKLEAAKREAAKAEAARVEAAKREAAKLEAARVEAAKREAAKVEAARVEAAKREATRLEAAKREAAKLEAARVEAAKREAAKLEAARVEAAKREEAARAEAAKREAERAEAAKREEAAKAEAAKREQVRVAAVDGPVGTLALSVKPACDIFIDGKQLGTQVTDRELVLPAGRHRVALVSTEHGLKDTFFVEVRPGAIERIAKEFNVPDKAPPVDKTKNRDATINPFEKAK